MINYYFINEIILYFYYSYCYSYLFLLIVYHLFLGINYIFIYFVICLFGYLFIYLFILFMLLLVNLYYHTDIKSSFSSSQGFKCVYLGISNDETTLAVCTTTKVLIFDIPTIIGGVSSSSTY